jgi:hypothetical protein
MADGSTSPRSGWRALLGALAVGLLFAALCGIEASGSGRAEPNQSTATASVGTGFDAGSALLGWLLGAPLGGLAGALFGRRGLAGAAGFILVVLAGGLAGLVVAALLAAQTRVAVSGNSVSVEHGAPVPALVAGAALGLLLGGLGAWWIDYRRSVGPGRQIQAGPSAADRGGMN